MARELTTDFKAACIAGTVRPLVLIDAEFDSGTLRLFNGVGTFEYDSNTYFGSGNLLRTSNIVETQQIEARGVNYDLSGVPSSIVAIAEGEEYQGRPITQTLVLLDAGGLTISDPYVIFSGEMDVMTIDMDRKTAAVRLSAENDLITLTRGNERRHTSEDQKLKYPDDTFFDYIAALQSKEITWGKNAK